MKPYTYYFCPGWAKYPQYAHICPLARDQFLDPGYCVRELGWQMIDKAEFDAIAARYPDFIDAMQKMDRIRAGKPEGAIEAIEHDDAPVQRMLL